MFKFDWKTISWRVVYTAYPFAVTAFCVTWLANKDLTAATVAGWQGLVAGIAGGLFVNHVINSLSNKTKQD